MFGWSQTEKSTLVLEKQISTSDTTPEELMITPPSLDELSDFSQEELSYLPYENSNTWEYEDKKSDEHTGYYRHIKKNRKIYVKKDKHNPENNWVDVLLSIIMRKMAPFIGINPQLIAQNQIIKIDTGKTPGFLNKESIHVASTVFPNFLPLWKHAYLLFNTSDKFKDIREKIKQVDPQDFENLSILPKERPAFFAKDFVLNTVIASGYYGDSYNQLMEIRRVLGDADAHPDNMGVTTGEFIKDNQATPVIVLANNKIIPLTENKIPNEYVEDYKKGTIKLYWIFEKMQVCSLDFALGLKNYQQITYTDNLVINLFYHFPLSSCPPQFIRDPESINKSSDRFIALAWLSILPKEFMQLIFTEAAKQISGFFDLQTIQNVAEKKLGMKKAELEKWNIKILIKKMAVCFAEAFQQNQQNPIKSLIYKNLDHLEKKEAIQLILAKSEALEETSIEVLKQKWIKEIKKLIKKIQPNRKQIEDLKLKSEEETNFLKELDNLLQALQNKLIDIQTGDSTILTTKDQIELFIKVQTECLNELIDAYFVKIEAEKLIKHEGQLRSSVKKKTAAENNFLNNIDLIIQYLKNGEKNKPSVVILRKLIQFSLAISQHSNTVLIFERATLLLSQYIAQTKSNESKNLSEQDMYLHKSILKITRLLTLLGKLFCLLDENSTLKKYKNKILAWRYKETYKILSSFLDFTNNDMDLSNLITNLNFSISLVENLNSLGREIKRDKSNGHSPYLYQIDQNKILDKLINNVNEFFNLGCNDVHNKLSDQNTSLDDLHNLGQSITLTTLISKLSTNSNPHEIKDNLPSASKSLLEGINILKGSPSSCTKLTGSLIIIAGLTIAISGVVFMHLGIGIPLSILGIQIALGGLTFIGGAGTLFYGARRSISKKAANIANLGETIANTIRTAPTAKA